MAQGNSHLRLWGDFYKVPVFERAKITKHIEDFFDKVNNKCQHIELSIKLEDAKKTFRQVPIFDCRINLVTNRGRYYAFSEEVGPDFAVKESLEQLKTQIFKRMEKLNFEHYNRLDKKLPLLQSPIEEALA